MLQILISERRRGQHVRRGAGPRYWRKASDGAHTRRARPPLTAVHAPIIALGRARTEARMRHSAGCLAQGSAPHCWRHIGAQRRRTHANRAGSERCRGTHCLQSAEQRGADCGGVRALEADEYGALRHYTRGTKTAIHNRAFADSGRSMELELELVSCFVS